MIQISSGGRPDSSGRWQSLATDALLGVLAVFFVAKLTPVGGYELAGTVVALPIGAVGGALIGRLFRRRVMVAIDVVLMVTYIVVAGTPIVVPFTSRWIRADALPSDTVDAVVVLSASILSDSSLSATAADRLLSGLELMRAGRARRLITTRQVQRGDDGDFSSDADQQRLISLASVNDKWTVIPGARTTRDEALLTGRFLIPQGERRIIVVTSPLHTRRACAVFEAVGFSVVCRPARERTVVTNPPFGVHDRLGALRSYIYELAAFLKYRALGWLTPRPVVTPGTGGSS